MANEIKYCRKCGVPVEKGAVLCTNCGYLLSGNRCRVHRKSRIVRTAAGKSPHLRNSANIAENRWTLYYGTDENKVSKYNLEKSGGKALHVGNGTSYPIDFTINRICIPQE